MMSLQQPDHLACFEGACLAASSYLSKTGKAATRIMSVRQQVFGERRLSNGGKAETLIMLFHSTTKEANHSFCKHRF